MKISNGKHSFIVTELNGITFLDQKNFELQTHICLSKLFT